jgi:hypothetical protein
MNYFLHSADLISAMPLTRAVNLMSAYVLNTVYRQTPGISSVTLLEEGRALFIVFRVASCSAPCCRGVVCRQNIVRCSF